jgi:hypothetical protein
MIRSVNQVLDWLLDPARPVRRIAGRYRMHASQEGNALLVCCRLGLGGDPRVSELASRLAEWQWSDGGWNCDPRPEVTHSSFHESLAPLRGLVAQGTFSDAATRAADFFLRHRLYRSESGDMVIDREWLRLHWPAYWHYDFLQGLRAIAEAGMVTDLRAKDALDQLEERRSADGRWRASGRRYWRRAGGSNLDVVDWGDAADVLTAQVVQVLSLAGRRPAEIRSL